MIVTKSPMQAGLAVMSMDWPQRAEYWVVSSAACVGCFHDRIKEARQMQEALAQPDLKLAELACTSHSYLLGGRRTRVPRQPRTFQCR